MIIVSEFLSVLSTRNSCNVSQLDHSEGEHNAFARISLEVLVE